MSVGSYGEVFWSSRDEGDVVTSTPYKKRYDDISDVMNILLRRPSL